MTHIAEYHETGTTTPATEPGPTHQRLNAFVGEWFIEGHQFESPFGAAAQITATETYEWLPGRFFLMHRMDGQLGDRPLGCVEIIEFDAAIGVYALRTYYNDGTTNDWEMRERIGQWIITGAWPRDNGESWSVRCTMVFGKDGNTRIGRWEYSEDGAKWDTFWALTATKVGR